MSRRAITSLRQISDINLTPLVDLTFLLLISFIITFPLMESGIPINLPQARASKLEAPDRSRTISLDQKGKTYLDEQPIGFEALRREMLALGRQDPDVTVMVRADERLAYGSVVKVLKLLHEARVTRMALVTREEEQGAAP